MLAITPPLPLEGNVMCLLSKYILLIHILTIALLLSPFLSFLFFSLPLKDDVTSLCCFLSFCFYAYGYTLVFSFILPFEGDMTSLGTVMSGQLMSSAWGGIDIWNINKETKHLSPLKTFQTGDDDMCCIVSSCLGYPAILCGGTECALHIIHIDEMQLFS